MKKTLLTLAIVGILLNGCATKATHIPAQDIPTDQFANLSCEEIKAELTTRDRNLITLAKKQKTAARIDFWIAPVSKISGMDKKKEISKLKGEINALLEMNIIKNCNKVILKSDTDKNLN
jgi:hypothetical protein